MARWAASAKWAAGPALDGQRDVPLVLRLSEGLGFTFLAEAVVVAGQVVLGRKGSEARFPRF